MTANAKEPMMNKTTLCFGRFLIDFPKGVQIKEIGQQSQFMFDEIKSERFSGGMEEFEKIMKEREIELKAGKQRDEFKLTDIVRPTGDSRIFKLSRKFDLFPNDPPSTGLELYRWHMDEIFSMKKTGFSSAFPQIVERLKSHVVPSLRARKLDEAPSQSGFCIKNGFIADDGSKYQFEEARMQINLKEWPDVWISVFSQTVSKAGDSSLLQRLDKHPDSPLEAALIKTFRRGKHEVHGFKGEEILELLPTEEGFKQHSFRWEAMGAIQSIFTPRLVLELESGVPLKGTARPPSLTDAQAIKLYDDIVNSIRLRPIDDPSKQSAAEPIKTPLGELTATGGVCPQSGWWECSEKGDVAGGRRQHFRAGELMPKAILQGTPNAWQKIKGERPLYQTTTVWHLVGYDAVAQTVPPVITLPEIDAAKDVEPPTDG